MELKSAVLFDLDGTLLDTAPDLLTSFNLLLSRHKKPTVELPAIRHLLTRGSAYFIKHFFDSTLSSEELQNIRLEYLELYSESKHSQTKMFLGINEVLIKLTALSLPWGIVTNKLTQHAHENLACLTLPSKPAVVVCGDTLDVVKPDPKPLLYACDTMGVSPQTVLFVGDSDVDALAGKNAGIDTIILEHGYNSGKEDFSKLDILSYLKNPLDIIEYL